MASQSLYRKWRSQTFGEVVGQEAVIETLKNALTSEKLAHAYLFTGPRGTGKTSIARLLAKTVNCPNSVGGEPCNQCQQCREITIGNSFNVIEIDAASNRGIDSIRDLREKVMMPPATGKYKVYVLDEAHMLTTEACNALLKTLEEPPDYAIFVLATTEVHKMLPTVLSRCQQFHFKRITTRKIVEHVHFVAEQEHVKLERPAAELIARTAAGGMRDALSLLDQAIAYAGEEISLVQMQTMLGVADPRAIQKLVMHIAHLESADGLYLIHELSEGGADLRQVNTQLGEYWRALMLARAGADVGTIMDRTEDETREIVQAAKLFELEELTECARICAQNDLVQKSSGTPQLGLELAFLECLNLHRRAQAGQPIVVPTSVPSQPAQRTTATPMQSRSATGPSRPTASTPQSFYPPRSSTVPERTGPPSVDRQPSPSPVQQNREAGDVGSLPDWDDLGSLNEGDGSGIVPTAPTVRTSATDESLSLVAAPTTPTEDAQGTLTVEQVKDGWENVKKRVRQKNAKTAGMLIVCSVVSIEGGGEVTNVLIQAGQDIPYKFLQTKDHCEIIEWALSLEFRQQCRIRLLPPGQSLPRVPGSRSANTMLAPAPQPSAYREPPAPSASSPPTPPTPPTSASALPRSEPEARKRQRQEPSPTVQETAKQSGQEEPTKKVALPVDVTRSEPLARTNVVRENTSTLVSQETLDQKARQDPVVKEVERIFAAKIIHVQPK